MTIKKYLPVIFLGYVQNLLYLSMLFFQQSLNFTWTFMREIIILEDIATKIFLIFLELYLCEKYTRMERSVWMRNRYTGWWEEIVPQFTFEDWLANFRMSKITFKYICNKLDPALRPKFNPLMPREPVSVEKQAAIAIFVFATCCEYRAVGHLFGVHNSTVWKCIHRVTNAINEILMPIWIQLPNKKECEKISKEFQKITGMPNFVGAVDGSHIPIVPPLDGYRDFINRKGWASYVLQGLVDHKLRFRNINIESPGCNHDANVFRNSELYKNYGQLMCQTKKLINGVRIPFLVMGDLAYPLLTWLMKGFIRTEVRSANEESFNAYMNSGRVKVELAFGRLKSRWRRLAERSDVHYSFVPKMVAACCTLHNILETRRDDYDKNWEKQRKYDELLFPQPERDDNVGEDTADGKRIRNVLLDIVSQLSKRKSLH